MDKKIQGFKMKLKVIVELRERCWKEAVKTRNLQFEVVLIFPSSQTPPMGSVAA